MPRICTTCSHPQRAEIDRLLATGEGAKRRIAPRYGLSDRSLRRHARFHLDPALIEAHEASLKTEAMSARDVIVEAVTNLRDDMRATRGIHSEQYMAVIDRLVKANDQFARINKEMGSDQVNALFMVLGVKGQEELESRLAVTRQAEEAKPAQVVLEACEVLEKVWRTNPELRTLALNRLNESSYALEETNGHKEA